MGVFQIPIRPDDVCDTLFHFDLAIAPDSVATPHAFTTISGSDLPPERANTASTTASSSTASSTISGPAAGATSAASASTASSTTTGPAAGASTALSKATVYEGEGDTVYDRAAGRISSLQAPAVLPFDSSDFVMDHEPDLPDMGDMNAGIHLLQPDDDSDTKVQAQPTAKISSRLRFSGQTPLQQQESDNERQARALRTVGIDNVLHPLAVEILNTDKQTMNSPPSAQWMQWMRSGRTPNPGTSIRRFCG
ncbi:unnamed protein product [Ectocarpus sp. 12 AP-2014]